MAPQTSKHGKTVPWLPNTILQWGSAILSASLVAPMIYIVDKAIISNASGKEPLGQAIVQGFKTLFSKPREIFTNTGFKWVLIVYSGTYIVGNTIEMLCYYRDTPSFYPKFVGSSAANITLSVLKDRVLTRMYGVGSARPLPAASYLLFGTRDSMTILAGFSLPDLFSEKYFQKELGMQKNSADVIAQLVTPLGIQVFSCPMHLYGIDLYNHPVGSSELQKRSRLEFIKREYFKTLLARQARILPSFGIAGVTNKWFRSYGKQYLEENCIE
eukprot:TRINITY_DN8692_c0_g1_i1.p1 TRINITY_DN8692_c0_g1~~TRINITY_DN8692_c0_g1_i1.p1  ORF type:complete len:283 (+),score=42.75 TRINITY_DN8692_c0_g1_i1:39-851(+)